MPDEICNLDLMILILDQGLDVKEATLGLVLQILGNDVKETTHRLAFQNLAIDVFGLGSLAGASQFG